MRALLLVPFAALLSVPAFAAPSRAPSATSSEPVLALRLQPTTVLLASALAESAAEPVDAKRAAPSAEAKKAAKDAPAASAPAASSSAIDDDEDAPKKKDAASDDEGDNAAIP